MIMIIQSKQDQQGHPLNDTLSQARGLTSLGIISVGKTFQQPNTAGNHRDGSAVTPKEVIYKSERGKVHI